MQLVFQTAGSCVCAVPRSPGSHHAGRERPRSSPTPRAGPALIFATRLLPEPGFPPISRPASARAVRAPTCGLQLLVGVSVLFGHAVNRALRSSSSTLRFTSRSRTLPSRSLRLATCVAGPLLWRRITRLVVAQSGVLSRRWLGYIAWWAIRHRECSRWNPAIPGGGFVGESKSAILARRERGIRRPIRGRAGGACQLRPRPGDDPRERLSLAGGGAQARHRGTRIGGAKRSRSMPESLQATVRQTPTTTSWRVYVRRPGDDRGWIFSLTEKQFPSVTGDGTSTLRNSSWPMTERCAWRRFT